MNPWDTFWKHELFRIKDLQSHWITSDDRRRVLRFVKYLQEHYPLEDVLDVSCGIGMKSSEIAKAGFTVLGTDASPIAIEGARLYYASSRLNFMEANWEILSCRFQEGYGVLYNDCFSWIYESSQLLENSKEFLQCLRKGGAFFFYAYADKDTAAQCMVRDANPTSNECFWVHKKNQETTTCSIHREIGDDYIDVAYRYVFVSFDESNVSEEAVLRQVYKWAFIELKYVLQEAGFSKVEQIDDHGLCCAHK